MRYFNTFVLLVFTLFLTSFNSNCYSQYKLKTIVIDAGHGGKDVGAIGVSGLQENSVTLDVAKKLGKLLKQNYMI